MFRHHLHRALALAGGLALTCTAAAQSPHAAAPARANAAPEAQHADKANGDDKHAKADDSKGAATTPAAAPGAAAVVKTDSAKDDPAQKAARHAERVKTEHEAERAKLAALLHAPMDDATRDELKQHARRVARIERIKELATEAKDNDSIARAGKLLDKENARHDKWMTNAAATAQAGHDSKGGAR